MWRLCGPQVERQPRPGQGQALPRRHHVGRLRARRGGRGRPQRSDRLPPPWQQAVREVRPPEPERLPYGLPRGRGHPPRGLSGDLVPRTAPDQAQRGQGLCPGRGGEARVRAQPDRRPGLQAPADALPARPAGAAHDRRRRLQGDPDARGQLLRQPAPGSDRPERPVRPRGDRYLGVLKRPHRLDAGRPDRDPRDERAVVDRPRCLERLHPRPQPRAHAPLRGHARRDAGRDPAVRRPWAVVAAAALAAGLAATLAALAGSPGPAGIDPQQAVLDGCGRDYNAEVGRYLSTWVYVGDHAAPAVGPPPPQQRLEGLVSSSHFPQLASHPTEEDLPTVHRAYDFNFDVLPDRAYSGLLGGDPTLHTGNFAGNGPSTARLHVEREQTAFPSFAWPEPGDRIALVGSWIWDCGHWITGGERTELHSFRALWRLRNPGGPSPLSPYGEREGDLVVSNEKTFAGVEPDCAHATKVDVLAFHSCLSTETRWADVRGTYRFRLKLPARPSPNARLRLRVLDAGSSRGAPRARATVRGRVVDVSLEIARSPARRLVVAERLLA